MSKGLIIGMAGLGVGLACLGGVGGYYLNSALTKTPTLQTEYVAEAQAESDFVDYVLPEEFAYVSYSAYDIGENFSLISSSSVGTYLLNRETSEFTFFNSASVSTYSSEINGYKYFWLNNYNLFRINTQTGEYEVVALNSGISFTSLSFLGTSGNKLIMKGYSNSSYYLVVFNTKKGESEVYSITNTQYNYIDTVIETNGKYYLSKLYSNSSSSGSTYSSYIIDQSTGESTTLSSYCLYSSSTYTIHGTKMYALMRYSTSSYLCVIDFSENTVTQLSESTVSSYGTFFELEKGILYAYKKSLNNSSWSSMYAYYISYTDDSVTILTQDDANVYVCAIEVEGQLFLAPYTTSYTYATLATFNESTKEIETAYTVLVASSSYSMCSIYTFNDKYYVSSDNSNFARMDFDEDGNVTFTRVNLKCSITGTNYELAEGKYLFISEGIKYYDFENDVYKALLSSSSYTIKDLTIEDSIVTIYVSNHVKYEFNLDTLTFKAVAYWESAE